MVKVIGIVGSRRRDSAADYVACLAAFRDEYIPGDRIVSGGCPKGGDRFAEVIAGHVAEDEGRELSEVIVIHLPDRSKLDPDLVAKNPRAAHAVVNNARNSLIARDCDVLIAVVAQNRSGGTEDTIKKACALGKPVVLME